MSHKFTRFEFTPFTFDHNLGAVTWEIRSFFINHDLLAIFIRLGFYQRVVPALFCMRSIRKTRNSNENISVPLDRRVYMYISDSHFEFSDVLRM